MDKSENTTLQCATNKVAELENRGRHTFPPRWLFLISPVRLPAAMLNPCDDGASLPSREWQPFFQPEHKCLSVTPVYRLLSAAERGELTPVTFVLVGIRKSGFSKKLFKDGVAHKQAEIYPTINHGWCWPLLSTGSEACQQTLHEGKEQTADTCLHPPSSCATFLMFHLSTFWQAHVCFSKIAALPVWPTLLGLGFVLRLHRTSTSTLWCDASC